MAADGSVLATGNFSNSVNFDPSPNGQLILTALGNQDMFVAKLSPINVSVSGVVVAEATPGNGVIDSSDQLLITWAVGAADSVGSESLTVNGNAVPVIFGPYGAGAGTWYLGGLVGPLSTGTHSYTIVSADSEGQSATVSGTFNVAYAATIDGVVVTDANPNGGILDSNDQALITWAFHGAGGVGSSSLTVNGNPVNAIFGPYNQDNGTYDMAGVFGPLSAGSHSYTIQSADSQGNTATASGTFTVAVHTGPTISGVVVNSLAAVPVITWNVADTAGIASTALSVDGTAVTTVYGPYGTANSANYAGAIGVLPDGSHSYVITATNASGNSLSYSGTFNVAGDTLPLISGITVYVPPQGPITPISDQPIPVITWNVVEKTDGIASSSITVDGSPLSVFGPYGTEYNANYSADIRSVAAGAHTYTITATNTLGQSTTSTGTFTVNPQSAALASSALGTAKTDWLIDYDALAPQSSGTDNSADAVLAA